MSSKLIVDTIEDATGTYSLALGSGNSTFPGGIHIGGTGSANLLDDYEEGTWTPVVRGSTTAGTYTYSGQDGYYTKVGRMICASFRLIGITTSSAGTGYMQITGLPFSKTNNNLLHQGSIRLQSFNWNGSSYSYPVLEFTSGSATSVIYVRLNGDNVAGADLQASEIVSGSSSLYGQLTYFDS